MVLCQLRVKQYDIALSPMEPRGVRRTVPVVQRSFHDIGQLDPASRTPWYNPVKTSIPCLPHCCTLDAPAETHTHRSKLLERPNNTGPACQ